MKRFVTRCALLALTAVTASCAPALRESPGPAVPEPPPLPEPVLVRSGLVFAYDTGSGILSAISGPDAVLHEVALGRVTVRARTPPGWSSSYAGDDAAWFQRANESGRIVVHLTRDHAAEFRDVWLDRDLHDPAVRVSPVQSFDSERHPLLYTYERSDDGRRGIVYALLSGPADPASGILVHGVWPSEQDRAMRPILVALANGVTRITP